MEIPTTSSSLGKWDLPLSALSILPRIRVIRRVFVSIQSTEIPQERYYSKGELLLRYHSGILQVCVHPNRDRKLKQRMYCKNNILLSFLLCFDHIYIRYRRSYYCYCNGSTRRSIEDLVILNDPSAQHYILFDMDEVITTIDSSNHPANWNNINNNNNNHLREEKRITIKYRCKMTVDGQWNMKGLNMSRKQAT